jgi:2-phosphosulfolactate phosphatase
MKINILEFTAGARNAEGLTVIIDVFRAFSVACYAYDAGATAIISTGETEKAFALKSQYKNAVLVGERDEKKVPGFDFGNSPTELLGTDLKGKTVIHTTTAGTNGLVNAKSADTVITGSLVNASAIIRYIKKVNPSVVSLVAMGYRATESANEDLLCARIIEAGLKNRQIDIKTEIEALKSTSGKRFFLPENEKFSPPSDFFLCTMMDRFDFVLLGIKRDDGNINLVREFPL